uniref:Putative secreted protein n=1 Tax=Anopheles darlingi TaxID=43151 RepID=A0A2M4DE32_ANODA
MSNGSTWCVGVFLLKIVPTILHMWRSARSCRNGFMDLKRSSGRRRRNANSQTSASSPLSPTSSALATPVEAINRLYLWPTIAANFYANTPY